MRISPVILPLMTLTLACAHGQQPPVKKGSAQYEQVTTLAANELKCADDQDIDVRPVGDSRVVVTACQRSTAYVYACRQPGPRERAFVSNTPAPPTEETIETAAETAAESKGDPEAEQRVLELRQIQIKYNQNLVESRLADVQAGTASGYLPRHKMPNMPKFWFERECQYMHDSER